MPTEKEKNELVEILDKSLKDWALEDIKKAAIRGEAKMAGFILGSCFIDVLAGFYSGVDESMLTDGKSSERYKKFVEKYLSQYNSNDFYKNLRCKLVHNYSEGGSYLFTDANRDGKHFEKYENKTILNLEDFIKDIEDAYNKLRADILNNDSIYQNSLRRYNSIGLLHHIPKK